MLCYKLLNQDLTTYGSTRWTVGEWKTTDGAGDLCGPGWLHAYPHAELAGFLNPIHANIADPVLYECEGDGQQRDDQGFKVGFTKMRLRQRLLYTAPTTEQRIRFALACAAAVYADPVYRRWAERWIDGTSRAGGAAAVARAAAAAVRAAAAAVRAAAEGAVNLHLIACWALSSSTQFPTKKAP